MGGTVSRSAGAGRKWFARTLALAVAAGLVASVASAQEQQAAPPAQQSPFVLGGDTVLMFLIKGDKTADFEAVVEKLHIALANSDKPERKQQAAGWKIFKSDQAGPNGTAIYFLLVSPALKGADYSPSKILAEAFPSEAQELFGKYKEAFGGMIKHQLSLVADLGTPKAAPAPPQ